MTSAAVKSTFKKKLPILFVNIAWARRYDGTEPLEGNFAWLRDNPDNGAEARAFVKDQHRYFQCGIGKGSVVCNSLHIVFVANDPLDRAKKVVGLYAAAVTKNIDSWYQAYTKNAVLLDSNKRPTVPEWAGKQNMRRWAWRGGEAGIEYPILRKFFDGLVKGVVKGRASVGGASNPHTGDEVLDVFEGQEKKYFVRHRKRESRLRREKISDMIQRNKGRLLCEVPRCGFDYQKRYGKLGSGYAQVHHLKPLSDSPKKGQKIALKDLAVVCANCHVMIHLGGQCRPLKMLIPIPHPK